MSGQLLSPTQVNDEFPGLTPRWLARRRCDGLPPAFAKLGHRILYKRADIDQLVADATVRSV